MTNIDRYKHIPQELQEQRQWLVWKGINKGEKKPDGSPKLSKVPFNAKTGGKGSTTDPATWCTFEEAVKVSGRYSGIGFVFSKDDPYMGVDLDNCRNAKTGDMESWAAEIVAHFDSYGETSVSKTGVHIILKDCHKPGPNCKKKGAGGHPGADVEMYEDGRYFCFTGDLLEQKPEQVNSCQDDMNWLYNRLFPAQQAQQPRKQQTAALDASDADLLEIARQSKQGPKFSALWSGDMSAYGGDHSAADLGLMSMLAFYTQRDEARMDRMFRQSGLMREKWEKRADYRAWTIEKAIQSCTEVYTPKSSVPAPAPAERANLYRMPEVQACIRTGGTVYLVGSMEDADRLYKLGVCATVIPFARRMDGTVKNFISALRGSRVVIIPRNTQPAKNYALQIAQELQGVAQEVRGLILPELAKGAGISEWIDSGGTRSDLESIVAQTRVYRTSVRPSHRVLPQINAIEQDVRIICQQIWEAVEAANAPERYFLHAGSPSRLETLFDGRTRLVELTPIKMLAELTMGGDDRRGVADFVAIKTKYGNEYTIPAKLGLDVVNLLLADARPPLPAIERITETPIIAYDGSISVEPGYHRSSRSYHTPMAGLVVPPVPERPTQDEITHARELLYELVCDFPFVEEADRAHSIALLLLPFVRDLIVGATPNHLIEAPMAGSGKTLLSEALLYPSVGEASTNPNVGYLAESADSDEWRKQITTTLRGLPIAAIMENINRPLDSGHLARALTATAWKDRLLGKNDDIEVGIRCVWVTTATNPTMTTEIARRSIRIRIDPKADQPWNRTPPGGYKHDDLKGWANQMRGELVHAALVLGANWLALGRPRPQIKPLGSYENWSYVIGGILESAGISGFLSNLTDFYKAADQEGSKWRDLVEAWWETFGSIQVGTQELFPIARDLECFSFGRSREENAQRASFGKQLSKQRDRVIGDYRITDVPKSHGAKQWALECITIPLSGEVGEVSEDLTSCVKKNEKVSNTYKGLETSPTSPTSPNGTLEMEDMVI